MGQVFSQMTNPGTALQSPSGQTMAVGSPQQIQGDFWKQGAQANNTLNPGPPNFSGPHIGTPSFQDAASAGATPGAGNAMSPGLTKAGKLAVLMTSGIQGALAGHAANEQATVQSGGRRSGGAGMGFEAGYRLPWQRAEMGQQLQQEQAKTQLLQAQSQMVPTPYGQMPAGLAKLMFPAMIRAQGAENVAQTAAGSRENVAQTAAGAKVQAEQIGQRYKAVPGVGLFDTQTRTVMPGSQQGILVTPEIQKDYDLPPEFLGKPMKLTDLSSLERAQNQQNVVTQGTAGPALVNKRTAQTTPLNLGSPSMSGIVPVAADPDNPGNITYAPKTQAVNQGMAS